MYRTRPALERPMSLLRGQDKIEEGYFSQDNGPRLSTDETKEGDSQWIFN